MPRLPLLLAALIASSSLAMADGDPPAAPEGEIDLVGDLPQLGPIRLADLEALGAETARWKVSGKTYEVVGVPLWKVLERHGFTAGSMAKGMKPSEKRAGWKKILIATSGDGFEAIFTCAELFPSMGSTKALVVYRMDGKPLPPETGPFRLAVLTDKEPSRSVFSVRSLEVRAIRGAK